MGKINEYSLLKAEVKMELEIENLEKLIEAKEETKALAQKMQEVLNEIQMGVSQLENEIRSGLGYIAPEDLNPMLNDINDWIEEGFGAVK